MANPITTSAGDLENQLLEVAKALADKEAATTPPGNTVQINLNENNGTVTLTATMPAAFTANAGGGILVEATEYVPDNP